MTLRYSLAFSIVLGIITSPLIAIAQVTETEPNNPFPNREILPPGETTVEGTITPGTLPVLSTNAPLFFEIPGLTPGDPFVAWTNNSDSSVDTILGTFDQSLNLIATDDDSSPVGSGLASALGGTVNPDGSINLGVTGFADFDFIGDTSEAGAFELFISLGTEDITDIDPRDFDFSFADELILTEESPFIPGDVDFFTFTDLTPGDILTAEIIDGNIDSVLGLIDTDGSVISSDDDGGLDFFSKLDFLEVPGSGEITLAVSAFADFGFEGLHRGDGLYTLNLSESTSPPVPTTPEPTSMIGISLVLGLFSLKRRQN